MNNINKSNPNVDAKQSGNKNANKKDIITIPYGRSTPFIDSDALRAQISMVALLKRDGHKIQRSGKYVKCRCPFHDDDTPSFNIYDDRRGYCFGCKWHGDAIGYTMKQHRLEFVQALKRLDSIKEEVHTRDCHVEDLPPAASFSNNTGKKTDEKSIQQYRSNLVKSEWRRLSICNTRTEKGHKWAPKTLKQLADEGSLGWTGEALAFIYPKGVKYREWPGKRFIWESEGASMWREHRIKAATTVYLCESETDAIAAISAGVEKDDSVAAIAISGVNSFKAEWTSMFRGKKVVLSFDNDTAGQQASSDLEFLFRSAGISVSDVDWKEVE